MSDFPEEDFTEESFEEDGSGGDAGCDVTSQAVTEEEGGEEEEEADFLEEDEATWNSQDLQSNGKGRDRSSSVDNYAEFENDDEEEEDFLDEDEEVDEEEEEDLPWEEVFDDDDDEDEALNDDDDEEEEDEELLLRGETSLKSLVDRPAQSGRDNSSLASLDEEDSRVMASSSREPSKHRTGSLGEQRSGHDSADVSMDNSASVEFDLGSYNEVSSRSSDWTGPENYEQACRELIAVVQPNSDADDVIRRCDPRILYTNLRQQHRHLVRRNPELSEAPKEEGDTWESFDDTHNEAGDTTVFMGGPFMTEQPDSHQNQDTQQPWGNIVAKSINNDAFECTNTWGSIKLDFDAANQLPFPASFTPTASSTTAKEAINLPANPSSKVSSKVSDDEGGGDDSPLIEKWLERNEDDPGDYAHACRRLSGIIYKGDEDHDTETMLRRSEPKELYRYLKHHYWYLVHTGQMQESKSHDVSGVSDDTDALGSQGTNDDEEIARWKDIEEAQINSEVQAMLSAEEQCEQESRGCSIQPTNSESFRKSLTESLDRVRNATMSGPKEIISEDSSEEESLTELEAKVKEERDANFRAEATASAARGEDDNSESDVEATGSAEQELFVELQRLKEEEARLLAEDYRLKEEAMKLRVGDGTSMYVVDGESSNISYVSLHSNDDSVEGSASMMQWTYGERTEEIDERTELLQRSGLLIREMSSESIIETDEEDESTSHFEEMGSNPENVGLKQDSQPDDNSLPLKRGTPELENEKKDRSKTEFIGDDTNCKVAEDGNLLLGKSNNEDQAARIHDEKFISLDGYDASGVELDSENKTELLRQQRCEGSTTECNEILGRQDDGIGCDENQPFLLKLAVSESLDGEFAGEELKELENSTLQEEASEAEKASNRQFDTEQKTENARAWKEENFSSFSSTESPLGLPDECALASARNPDDTKQTRDRESADCAILLEGPDTDRKCLTKEIILNSSLIREEKGIDDSFVPSAHLGVSDEFDEDQSRASTSSSIDSRTPKEPPPKISGKDPVELDWRKNQILDDLSDLIQRAEEEETGDIFSTEARTALEISSLNVALVKKYYDGKKKEYIYYPSVAKTIYDYSLIEEAEKYYKHGSEEFPLEYSTALCTIAASQLNGDVNEVDENDDFVKTMTVNVWLDNEELKESVESAMLKSMIQVEIDTLILDAEQQELDQTFKPEVSLALKSAALKVAYVRKYFNREEDKFVYFPSVAKCTYDFSLIEEAERHLRRSGGDEIDFVYTNALCTIAASYLRGNVNEVDEEDENVKTNSVDVASFEDGYLDATAAEKELVLDDHESAQNSSVKFLREESTEEEKRKEMIKAELDFLVQEAQETDIEGTFEEEAVNALNISAVRLAFVKKYFDVSSEEFVYFPSVAKTILDYSLIEEAERHYGKGESEFPLEYTSGLRAAAARAIERRDVDETDDYVQNMAVDVEIDQAINSETMKSEVAKMQLVEDKARDPPASDLDIALEIEDHATDSRAFGGKTSDIAIDRTDVSDAGGIAIAIEVDKEIHGSCPSDYSSGADIAKSCITSHGDERTVMVKEELGRIIARVDQSELEVPMESDAVLALNIAAENVCYRKKYYDSLNDNFIYFPSVARTILDYTLIDAAERIYFDGVEGFPSEYTACLRAVASLELDNDDLDYDYMEKLAVELEVEVPISNCGNGEARSTFDGDTSWNASVHDEGEQDIEVTIDEFPDAKKSIGSASNLQAIPLVNDTEIDATNISDNSAETLVRNKEMEEAFVVVHQESETDANGRRDASYEAYIATEESRLKEMEQILEFRRRVDKQKISDDAKMLEELKKQGQRRATENARILDEEKKGAEARLDEEASLLDEKWLDDERQINQALQELEHATLSEEKRLEAEANALEKHRQVEEERIEKATKEIEDQRLADEANYSQTHQSLRAKLSLARETLESERKVAEDEAKSHASEIEPRDDKSRGFFGFGGKGKKQDIEKEKQIQASLLEFKLREMEIEKEIQDLESEQARIQEQAKQRERERVEDQARLEDDTDNLEKVIFSVGEKIKEGREQLERRCREQQTLLSQRKADLQRTRSDDEKWLTSEKENLQEKYKKNREELARAAIEQREAEVLEEERLNRLAIALKERWVKEEAAFALEREAFERTKAKVNMPCSPESPLVERGSEKPLATESEMDVVNVSVDISGALEVPQSDGTLGPTCGIDLMEPLIGLWQANESASREKLEVTSPNEYPIEKPLEAFHSRPLLTDNGLHSNHALIAKQSTLLIEDEQMNLAESGKISDPSMFTVSQGESSTTSNEDNPDALKKSLDENECSFEVEQATIHSTLQTEALDNGFKTLAALPDNSCESPRGELPHDNRLPDAVLGNRLGASLAEIDMSCPDEPLDVENIFSKSVPDHLIMMNQPKLSDKHDDDSIGSLEVFDTPAGQQTTRRPRLAASLKAKCDETKTPSAESIEYSQETSAQGLSRNEPDRLIRLNQAKSLETGSSSIAPIEVVDSESGMLLADSHQPVAGLETKSEDSAPSQTGDVDSELLNLSNYPKRAEASEAKLIASIKRSDTLLRDDACDGQLLLAGSKADDGQSSPKSSLGRMLELENDAKKVPEHLLLINQPKSSDSDDESSIKSIEMFDSPTEDALSDKPLLAAAMKAKTDQLTKSFSILEGVSKTNKDDLSRSVPDHLVFLNQPNSGDNIDHESLKNGPEYLVAIHHQKSVNDQDSSTEVFDAGARAEAKEGPLLATTVSAKESLIDNEESPLNEVKMVASAKRKKKPGVGLGSRLLQEAITFKENNQTSSHEFHAVPSRTLDDRSKQSINIQGHPTASRPVTNATVIALLSSLQMDPLQAASQERCILILNSNGINHEKLFGTDPVDQLKRDALLAISGLPEVYPQFFVSNKEGTPVFLGTHETIEHLHSAGVLVSNIESKANEATAVESAHNDGLEIARDLLLAEATPDNHFEMSPTSSSDKEAVRDSSPCEAEDLENVPSDISATNRLSWWKDNGKKLVSVHLNKSPTGEKRQLTDSLILHNNMMAEERPPSADLDAGRVECKSNGAEPNSHSRKELAGKLSTPYSVSIEKRRRAAEAHEHAMSVRSGSQSPSISHLQQQVESSNEDIFRKARECFLQRVEAANDTDQVSPVGKARALEWAKVASGSPVMDDSNQEDTRTSVEDRFQWWRDNGKRLVKEKLEAKNSEGGFASNALDMNKAVMHSSPTESDASKDAAARRFILAEKRRQVVEARKAIKDMGSGQTTSQDQENRNGENGDNVARSVHGSTDANGAAMFDTIQVGENESQISPRREKELRDVDVKRKMREAEAKRLAERTQRARESRLARDLEVLRGSKHSDTERNDQTSQAETAPAHSVASEETSQVGNLDVEKKLLPPTLLHPMIRETDRLSGFIRRYENKLEAVCQSLLTVAIEHADDNEAIAAKELPLPGMLDFIVQQDWYKANSANTQSVVLPQLTFSRIDRLNRDSSKRAMLEAMGKEKGEPSEDKIYTVTAVGRAFLQMDGPMQADIGRFLTHLDHSEEGLKRNVMAEHWKEIAHLSGDIQSQRVSDKLDELISFCLDSRMIK